MVSLISHWVRADHPHENLIIKLNVSGFHPTGFPGYIGVQWCDWLLCQMDYVDFLFFCDVHEVKYVMTTWIMKWMEGYIIESYVKVLQ